MNLLVEKCFVGQRGRGGGCYRGLSCECGQASVAITHLPFGSSASVLCFPTSAFMGVVARIFVVGGAGLLLDKNRSDWSVS